MKVNKKYTLLLLWTFLTSLLLTASSYAWFSTNRILGFRSFNIHIASKGGIEISVDGRDWKGVVTYSDIIEARNTYQTSLNQIPNKIQPVSTAGNVSNGLLELYFGEVFQNTTTMENMLHATRTSESEGFGEESNGKFVVFDLFFKNPSPQTLYLTNESYIKQETELTSGIENAFRIAFLNQGTLNENSSIANIQNLNQATRSYIWEPNYDVHRESSVRHAMDTYGIITRESNASKIDYSGISKPIPKTANVKVSEANNIRNPQYFNKVNIDIATRKEFSQFEEIFRLEPGISKVRVYIWIEGQDVDCEDNSSFGEVLINLHLSTNPS